MIDAPSCPVCDASSWEVISKQTYRRDDSGLSRFTAERFEILFGLWAPGARRLTIEYVLCRGCGLVIYRPRPTAEEVAAKYARLGGASSSTVENPGVTLIDRIRSAEIVASVEPHLPAGARVLDFGGGTGSLMAGFVERGHGCAVVDYAPEAIPGVELLARTIDEVPRERRFELIVASHVVEHVTDPVATVRALAAHLVEGGFLYLEVPLELIGKAPRRPEPVTHINFFAEPSMGELLRRAELETVRCWTSATTHANGRLKPAVCALAQEGSLSPRGAAISGRGASGDVKRLVRGGRLARAAFWLRNPGLALNPLRRLLAISSRLSAKL